MYSMIEMRDQELKQLIKEISTEVESQKDQPVSQDQVCDALQDNWDRASRDNEEGVFDMGRRKRGREFLKRVQTFICARLDGNETNTEKIVKLALDGLALLMPAGLVAKAVVVIVVRFLVNLTISEFCEIKM